ncbi:hypothetical protein DPMN_062593 [Dreissena polymorpha]|uniref:Uncharacterized protein n=1 Tax=Dreissena polymorpha TaxID=45954 RepID=A0A9D4C9G8_DREPO|nr:hypothetical protein DPMN_062593 [Dreissena polymorpha]
MQELGITQAILSSKTDSFGLQKSTKEGFLNYQIEIILLMKSVVYRRKLQLAVLCTNMPIVDVDNRLTGKQGRESTVILQPLYQTDVYYLHEYQNPEVSGPEGTEEARSAVRQRTTGFPAWN